MKKLTDLFNKYGFDDAIGTGIIVGCDEVLEFTKQVREVMEQYIINDILKIIETHEKDYCTKCTGGDCIDCIQGTIIKFKTK